MSRNPPTNMDNVIDSRDVIARIEELEGERNDLASEVDDTQATYNECAFVDDESEATQDAARDNEAARQALAEWDEENKAELTALKALAEEAEDDAPDWHHGETLIRDSYFRGYAQELAEDIGAIDPKAGWPLHCIDWDQAARELQMDYTAVDFDGVTYWIR